MKNEKTEKKEKTTNHQLFEGLIVIDSKISEMLEIMKKIGDFLDKKEKGQL